MVIASDHMFSANVHVRNNGYTLISENELARTVIDAVRQQYAWYQQQ